MEINQLINELNLVNTEIKQQTERLHQLDSKYDLVNEICRKNQILKELNEQLATSNDQKENTKQTIDAIRDKVELMAENFKNDASSVIDLKKGVFKNLGLKIWIQPLEQSNEETWEIKVFYSESSKYFVVLQYFVPSDCFELISMNPTPPKFEEIKDRLRITSDFKGFFASCREYFIKLTIDLHSN